MSLEQKIILGVPTYAVKSREAIRLLDDNVRQGRQSPVAFLNANTALLSLQDKNFHAILQDFIIFNDGIGVDIASWLKYGRTYAENLNGTDFTPLYLAETCHRFRIFLLGGRPEVVEKTARHLTEIFPQHRIVGFCDGYSPRDGKLTQDIRDAQANLILVAMGDPLQEFWIADNLQKSGAALALGVGALFDFLAGRVPRAPPLWRKLRLEWLFRLCCEPKRLWGRYTLGSAHFIFRALFDALKYRLSANAMPKRQ